MATVDDKVVAMSFESTKFSTGISTAMSDLNKLNAALKNVGATNGLDGIEKSANKVTFGGLSSAIDKIKGKFHFPEATQGFSDVEKESGKVGLGGISKAIDSLKGKLSFPEAAQGFSSIEKESGKVSFTGLSNALENLKVKFSVLEGAASVALGNIATKAASAGGNVVKSFSFGPIQGGLKEYELQLSSVQTILSNTQASGATLKDVNKALRELNEYSDKTIYNFGQMARNIGTFTAAGVDLKTATASIKGIANIAALSGSSSEQAATAMYQLSQAISSGKVGLQDWNSVVNAGMGGAVFQRALAQTAESMGKLKDGAVSLSGPMKNVKIDGQSFRESIMAKPGEQSWLTSDVLTKTLKTFTGDMTDAQLKAEGFTAAQIKAIQAQAKTAVEAATKVKTLSGVLDTARESAESGWGQTWQIVFGDFEEARSLFTGMSNAINGFIGKSAEARNSVLTDWKELGGRTDLIEGIKNIFEGLGTVIKPIKEAFREIFPPKTGQDLKNITQAFETFTEKLKIGPETAESLKRTFAGLFALLSIGKQILTGIFTVIGQVFGSMGEGSGGVLNLTGSLGDLIVKLDNWLKKGDKLHDFFSNLGDILGTPVRLIGTLTGKLSGLFSSGDKTSGVASSLGGVGEALKPATRAIQSATGVWEDFLDILQKVGDFGKPILDAIGDSMGQVGETISNALENINFDTAFAALQTGLIAGIFLTIKKAIGGGLDIDIGGGVLKNLSGSLDVLQGSLTSIQNNIKANTLLQISGAVALLAAAVVALSLVNPDRLASSMTAIAVGLGQLMGAMALLSKIGGTAGFVKMPIIAASLILLAAAIDILAIAVIALSKLSWDEIARGLTAVAGLMVAIGLGSKLLSGSAGSLTAASLGLIALGVALNIMALAMKIFATMSWEELAKGLGGAAAGIVAIGLAANMLPASMLLTGPGLILLATGLAALGGAVKIFGSMDLTTMGKGLLGIAGSLVAIGLAMGLMPPTLPLTAAGLILAAAGLTALSGVIAVMGNMDVGTLAKGIGAIAASLAVLALGLTAMIVALPGAAALLVASAALAIFAPVLGLLGSMSWGTIAKGLGAIALAFVVIGTAGLIAAPALIALGAALAIFGVGILAVGAGVKLLASGISILASDGSKGVAVFIAALTALIAVMPKLVIDFIKGLVEIVGQIAVLAPKVVAAMGIIINQLLDFIIKAAPKFAEAATALIKAMLDIMAKNIGPMIDAGWDLLRALLKGMGDHISEVVQQAGNIIRNFLNAIANQIPSIARSGLNVLVQFIEAIADNLNRVVSMATTIVIQLVGGIANNISRIVTAGASMISNFITGIGNNIDQLIGRGAAMINRIVEGIGNNIGQLVDKGVDVATKIIRGLASAAVELAEAGGNALLAILRGIRRWVEANAETVGSEGRKIGVGLITGVANGVAGFDLAGALWRKFSGAVSWVKKKAGIKSPSQLTRDEIGKPLIQGVIAGVNDTSGDLNRSLEDTALGAVATMRKTLSAVPDMAGIDMQPTITPVLDLTQIRKDAAQLTDLTNVTPITAAASFTNAAAIQLPQLDADEAGPSGGGKVFKFEQNNYSPEALSEAEIYRQTNNQLSQAKAALGL